MNNVSIQHSEHDYGIALLRILSMHMIVILHILNWGGLLDAVSTTDVNYATIRLLKTLCMCSVNCYALISGYVGYNRKFRYSNLLVLWLRVLYYSIGITLFFSLFLDYPITEYDWMRAFFPIMTEHYWYFTAYVGMFMLLPLVRTAIHKMHRHELREVILCLIITYSFLQTFFRGDIFSTDHGYSPLWLLILYIIGAYIKKYNALQDISRKKGLVGYFLFTLGTWSIELAENHFYPESILDLKDGRMLYYISPIMLGAAICLMIAFRQLQVTDWLKSVIRLCTPLTFSIYLIHGHNLIHTYYFKNQFIDLLQLSPPALFFYVLCLAFLIYLGCSVLDLFREKLFRTLKLQSRLRHLEEKYIDMPRNKRMQAQIKPELPSEPHVNEFLSEPE